MEKEVSAGSCVEKKLRLFGFDLNPCNNNETSCCLQKVSAEGDESVNSSNTESSASDHQKPSTRNHKSSPSDDKKFECQYCFKEFANSQALGGHQNAHKKERMKKKRLQLQARKASLNSYLQPYYQNNYHGSTAWFYDPASCYPSDNYNQFTFYEESQNISFNPHHVSVSKWYTTQIPFQEDSSMFTLTSSRDHRPAVINKPSTLSASVSNQSCKSLDLQLGHSL